MDKLTSIEKGPVICVTEVVYGFVNVTSSRMILRYNNKSDFGI